MKVECPQPMRLSDYLQGQIDEESAVELDTHISTCNNCQETIAELESASGDRLLREIASLPCEDSYSRETGYAAAIRMAREAVVSVAPSASQSEATRPRILRDYQLLEKLGEGGMGAVYKAMHTQLERVVALKVLPLDKTNDPATVGRFRREMKAVGRLNHENIVQATDAGEHEGTHFLVMEYVEGADLSQLVKRNGPLPVAEACELIRQAAVGLEAAHEAGMIHRDIKPSNLMLTTSGTVKILDLGLARLAEAVDERELTTTGQIMGTVDYMSPEQCGSSHEVDIRTDIYSLGATLYKLLSGQAIFSGENCSKPMQKMMALATENPRPLSERRPGVPVELSDLVARMLEKDPADRPATPAEVAALLAPYADGANVVSLLDAPQQASLETAISRASLPTHASRTVARRKKAAAASRGRGGRRFPPAAILAAAGSAALLAVLGIVLFLQTPEGTLRLEINDPEIQVAVKGTEIVVSGLEGEKDLTLRPGDNTLVVTRGDFTFETESLVLRKGETIRVKVEALPDKVRVVAKGKVIGEHELPKDEKEPSQPPAPAGLIRIVNRKSNMALAIHQGLTTGGARLSQEPIDQDDPAQQWVREDAGDGFVRLKNHKSGLYLTFDRILKGEKVTQWPVQEGKEELFLWKFEPIREQYVQIVNEKSGHCLGVWGGKRTAGEWIIQWPFTRSEDQWWEIEQVASDSSTRKFPVDGTMDERKAWVVAELKRLNPGFDGNAGFGIAGEQIVGLSISRKPVSNIEPLARLAHLRTLSLTNLALSDLSPLANLPLEEVNFMGCKNLDDIAPLANCPLTKFLCHYTSISDLTPLEGKRLTHVEVGSTNVADISALANMPIRHLSIRGSKVTDVSPLKGMPLDFLDCGYTGVADLSPLADAPLIVLMSRESRISDLTPLRGKELQRLDLREAPVQDIGVLAGMPLVQLDLEHTQVSDLSPLIGTPLEDYRGPLAGNEEFLRQIKTLKSINGKPAAEVLATRTRNEAEQPTDEVEE